MTIYLIEYSPSSGDLIFASRLEGYKRSDAERARIAKELELRRAGSDHELVLIEAPSDKALERSHRRYFADLKEIASSASA